MKNYIFGIVKKNNSYLIADIQSDNIEMAFWNLFKYYYDYDIDLENLYYKLKHLPSKDINAMINLFESFSSNKINVIKEDNVYVYG